MSDSEDVLREACPDDYSSLQEKDVSTKHVIHVHACLPIHVVIRVHTYSVQLSV